MGIAIILRRVFYFFILASLLVLMATVWMWKSFINAPLLNANSQIIYIPPGSSIYSVARLLQSRKLLTHPKFFILLARLEGKEKSLKTGEYQLDPGITPHQLLTKLVQGKVILRQLTIVEGWTLKQVFASMNTNPYLIHTLPTLTLIDISKQIGANYANFEGTIYPDTYLFGAGITDTVILKKAFWSMQKSLNALWLKRAQDLPFNDPYSALIVASLIEKETAKSEERAQIAGVITRRLKKKMLLQIDASVIYGLGDQYSGKLTHEDLKKDTPYNTYLHQGLPPTPIAMPSLLSIIAALHPAPGASLYYVARGDGSHEFSSTLQEHHYAVRKYLIKHLMLDYIEWNSNFTIPWFDNPNLDQLNLFSGTLLFNPLSEK